MSEIPGRPIVQEPAPSPCTFVLFGATGDLTRRKLAPALYDMLLDGALPSPFRILGVSLEPLDPAAFRRELLVAVGQFSRHQRLDPEAARRFGESLDYLPGHFEDDATFAALASRLEATEGAYATGGNRVYYLATAAAQFPVILEGLERHGLLGRREPPFRRVVIEKPFGHDLASARALDQLVARFLDERQTFRIDHYLGKETVQNILVFRFGNTVFEPVWNRRYVDHVEITAAETLGMEGRGRFYDQTGVLRDIVQNHLLQVLSLCAMEVPLSFAADDVRDEKVRVLRALRPIAGEAVAREVVRGQYQGYTDEPGVAPGSRTATFVALKAFVDSYRWQGVPFYLRAGKRLAARRTEVAVHFQSIPPILFHADGAIQVPAPNVLTLRIQPDEGIAQSFVAKVPGDHLEVADVQMDMRYTETFGRPISEAYERLLLDCLRGDATLFARRDAVEAAWRFVTPILDGWARDPTRPAGYPQGSNGPPEADALLARDGRAWRRLT